MKKPKNTRDYHKVPRFEDGGAVEGVPLPRPDTRMFDEDGNSSENSPNFRTLSSKSGMAREKARKEYDKADRELEGTHDRSFGEHSLAAARKIWEGHKYRKDAARGGRRDPTNDLYDRRRVKRD